MKTLAEKIEVMQHCLNGSQIEMRSYCETGWEDMRNPIFNWSQFDYRVKPTPKKKIEMYQYLGKCPGEGGYGITIHRSTPAPYTVRRLDDTRIEMEVEE